MPVKVDMKGLDKLIKNLEKLHGTRQVPLYDIFTSEFIAECSTFSNLEELFTAGGFIVKSEADLDAISSDILSDFIAKNTAFESWEAMKKSALDKYVKSQIEAGIKK